MKKILLGKISSVFGIKGEVKIISYCQNAADIEKYQLFDKSDKALKLKISNKNKAEIGRSSEGVILIAKIEGVDDRTLAETLRGLELYANRQDFYKKLKKDEFYQVDLIGLDVVDEQEKIIGKVLAVNDFGGGAMLEIEFEKANSAQNLEKIENFPFKNDFFPQVDLAGGFVKINLPQIIKDK